MSTESLLKLLTESSPNLNGIPGGHNPITAVDVAGALALSGLHDEESYYARVKHGMAGDQQLNAIASMRIQRTLLTICALQRVDWPIHKSALLCDLVVRLDITPIKCLDCEGAGTIRQRPCLACNGTSKQRVTRTSKARFIGVKPKSYRDTWEKRESSLMDVLSGWDRRCSAGIANQLLIKNQI